MLLISITSYGNQLNVNSRIIGILGRCPTLIHAVLTVFKIIFETSRWNAKFRSSFFNVCSIQVQVPFLCPTVSHRHITLSRISFRMKHIFNWILYAPIRCVRGWGWHKSFMFSACSVNSANMFCDTPSIKNGEKDKTFNGKESTDMPLFNKLAESTPSSTTPSLRTFLSINRFIQ